MSYTTTILQLSKVTHLVETVQRLSLAKDLDDIIGIVRTVARNIVGADGSTFVLRDGNQCYYAGEDAISPLWQGSRFDMDRCISGWVMKHKEHAVIKDIYEDIRIPIEAYRSTFVKSMVMVPIRKINPIGAIGTYWAKTQTPSEEDLAFLQALADITAVSITNIEIRNNLENLVNARTKELSEILRKEKELSELKSTFVSMASHEFRTPLTTILSSVSLAEKYDAAEQEEHRKKHFNRIKFSVATLVDLLDDFLSLEKLQRGKINIQPESFELTTCLNEVISEVSGMCKMNQNICVDSEFIHPLETDQKILRNILRNLLSNAIKYSSKEIVVKSWTREDHCIIQVIDQGIGIPKDQQEFMFSKYFRATNSQGIEGTGLGLNIVKEYTTLLSGEIKCESTENKGTTFTLTLPMTLSAVMQA